MIKKLLRYADRDFYDLTKGLSCLKTSKLNNGRIWKYDFFDIIFAEEYRDTEFQKTIEFKNKTI
ncbi:hypothetical protein B0A80_16760 [Flavobacterium tructae]|nr:hypothetical protein B0A80_16760 [Flavobacterium tructae]